MSGLRRKEREPGRIIKCTKVNRTNVKLTTRLLRPTSGRTLTRPAYTVNTEEKLSPNQNNRQISIELAQVSPAVKHFNWLRVSAAKTGKSGMLPTAIAEIARKILEDKV